MTKILVISDVHANLTALEAVLKDAGKVNETWCLGDVAGYGPDPNECIERISALPRLTHVMGNHDFAALGEMQLEAFNGDARKAILWQQEVLTPSSREFLQTSTQEMLVKGNISLVHGSPRDPIWEYIMNTLVARINLDYFDTPWCLVGHTHFQAVFQYYPDMDEINIEVPKPSEAYGLKDRAIFNPGSVGQPRDRDPRAAYAILNPVAKTWEPHRVEYDVKAVQERILAAGLPSRHAERLAAGW
jgi:predicted phosphodiesterase